MAIEIVDPSNTPDEGRVIWNDGLIDLDGRINEVDLGIDAYSTTSASFVQPAVSATVSVTVDETRWMAVGQPVYMTTGGTYTVSSVTDTTHVVLTNLGYTGNAAVAATVASGKKVSPSGFGDTASATPDATETVKGKAELATQTETDTGTDDTRIVTPLKLASRTSTETRAGVVELATDTETQTGTDTARAITPANLSARSATETRSGIAEIATQTETDTGTDDVRIVTALKAATRYLAKAGGTLTGFLTLHADPTSALHAVTKQYADALVTGGASPASETVAGIAELATQTETNTGTDDARIVTPLKLASRTSTDTRAGVVELATDAETQTGTDTARAITPANLSARTSTETRSGVVELATDAETQTGTDTARAITPANLSARSATETRTGVAEIATQTETDTGTDDTRIVTPLKLANYSGLGGGSSYRTLVEQAADVGNATTSLIDTDLSFSVTANQVYRYEGVIIYNATAFTAGFAIGVSGPGTPDFATIETANEVSSGALTRTVTHGFAITVSASQNNSLTGSMFRFYGFFKTPTGGTFKLQFKNDETSSTITVKAHSYLEYW